MNVVGGRERRVLAPAIKQSSRRRSLWTSCSQTASVILTAQMAVMDSDYGRQQGLMQSHEQHDPTHSAWFRYSTAPGTTGP